MKSVNLASLIDNDLEPIFWLPERIGKPSAWWGHVPFAFWLMTACKPRLLVELGTHYGVSYAAFCEAVARNGLSTRCFAVDTWGGDGHAGFYGKEIYDELKEFHDKRYAAFSQLMQKNFDVARDAFEDGSVDLLHIDGYHSYEAVRHDFDTWRPKLSERAVVLFHDTNVHKDDFGVWRFFGELKKELPCFEFLHSYGLGLAAVGLKAPAVIQELCQIVRDNDISAIRERFSYLGARWTEINDENMRHAACIRQYEQEIAARNALIAQKSTLLAQKNALITQKDEQIAQSSHIIAHIAERFSSLKRNATEGKAGLLSRWTARKRDPGTSELAPDPLESIKNSVFFDPNFYLRSNPDVRVAGIDPATHYLVHGGFEGRNPGPNFSTQEYLNLNPDVLAAGLNPLVHYEEHGRREARQIRCGRNFVNSGLHSMRPARTAHPVPAPHNIALPAAAAGPAVSVVILSYGQVGYTLRCLGSIAADAPRCSVEIIVSDDCSGAADLDELAKVANLRVLRPEANLGFLRHANWAVAQSKGKYVLLLNNDTYLEPNAIDALYETAESLPNIGLVGSKLVYPDGRLQEAGGIVWSDASAWNYGRFDDPTKPEYNYLRDADYISGASILVPRAIWDQLGGFDEAFVPAYYEDVDLAFRLRQRGLRVVYQPKSVVTHYEGISHGTDVTSGVKAHQTINQQRLKERWLSTLTAEHYSPGGSVMRARDRGINRRIMLMIDHYAPEPDRDAGSRLVIDAIKSLQLDGWIIKFWPHNLDYSPTYSGKLQQMGVEILYRPWTDSFSEWLFENGNLIDCVFVSRPTVANSYIETLKSIIPNTPRIFSGVDVHFARMRMQAQVTKDPDVAVKAAEMETLERGLWKEFDVVLYPSQEEADMVKQLEPDVGAYAFVPFCFDEFRALRQAPSSTTILFVAGFSHPPNVDAATWLVKKIFPLVRNAVPLANLWLVGSNPPAAVTNLACEVVTVTGYVSDEELARRYAEARVSVVPLRFGAGVKMKVVEAVHDGLPLVTTPVGAQGLVGLGDAATVVSDAETIAYEIIRLLQDDASWIAQSQRQLDYARAHFSRQASIASIIEATNAAKLQAKARGQASDGRNFSFCKLV